MASASTSTGMPSAFFVRDGTLDDYVYLDHGAHWAIGALAGILIVSIGVEVPEIVTGLIGVFLILAAFYSSVRRNKRIAAEAANADSAAHALSDKTYA